MAVPKGAKKEVGVVALKFCMWRIYMDLYNNMIIKIPRFQEVDSEFLAKPRSLL